MRWTFEEEQFLLDNYYNTSTKYCAIALQRSTISVERKVQNLGLKNKSKNKTTESYLDELVELGYNNYPIEDYAGAHTPILHGSIACEHTWTASPTNILQGRGCPDCMFGGATKLYCIRYESGNIIFYKVGITNKINDVLKRYSSQERVHLTIVWDKTYSSRHQAYTAEQTILQEYKSYAVNFDLLVSGNTECISVAPNKP